MPKLELDRRDYFRLEDQIHLVKTPIERHMLSDDPYSSVFKISKQTLLISQLRSIENENHALFGQISETNRAIAQYLKAIDQKIECLAHYIVSDATEKDPLHRENVDLSEGGISFISQYSYEIDSYMHILMVLFPSHTSIAAIAQVKSVQLLEAQSAFRVGVEFVVLHEADRKQLARHIRRKQSVALRESRLKNESQP